MRYLKKPNKLRDTVKTLSFKQNLFNSNMTGSEDDSLEGNYKEVNRLPFLATMGIDESSIQQFEKSISFAEKSKAISVHKSHDDHCTKHLAMVAEQGADDSSSLASHHQLVVTKNKTRDRRKTVIPRTLV